MKSLRQLGATALFLAFGALLGHGQGITGVITGILSDPSGAAIANAKVTATNAATGRAFATATNTEGVFVLPSLPTGAYEVRFESGGFKAVQRKGLQLGADQTLRLDLALEVGAMTESVTVTGEAPPLRQEEATISDRFTGSRMEELPVSRSATNILRIVPGVVPNPSGFSNSVADGNINGGRATSSNFMVDGASAVNTNLTQVQFQPILEAVDEITIQTANYGAQYGRGGTAINVTTRPGSNEIHGSIFHFFQNDKLNANAYFNNATARQRPVQRFNLFGGAVSGPVRIPKLFNGLNRTFYTFAYEGTRQKGAANQLSTFPTEAMRGGNFSGLQAIFDPATFTPAGGGAFSATPFPNNQIPANRVASQSRSILPFYPAPNLPGSINNYVFLVPLPNDQNALNTRFDHNFTQNSRLTFRYGWRDADTASGNPIVFPGPAGAASPANANNERTLNTFHHFNGGHTQVVRPTIINDITVGYFFTHTQQLGPGSFEDWPSKLGFANVSGDRFPGASIATYQSFGGGNLSNVYPARNWDFQDMVSWVAGKHSLKFGGQFRTLVFYDWRGTGVNFAFDTQGTYNPLTAQTRTSTGNSFASFLLGYPSSTTLDRRAPEGFRFRQRYWAGFLQDDWKISRRLTLNLGIRWEATTPRTEDNDLQTVFNLSTLQVDIANRNGFPRTLRDTDWMNFQPRLGLAWTLNDKTVVRGGFGMFMLPTEVAGNTFTDPGPAQRTQQYLANGAQNLFPVTFANFAQTATVPPLDSPVTVNQNTNVSWMPRDFPNAYQLQWNLNVQRQLPWSTLVEIGYVGTRGVHLEFNRNLNTVPVDRLTAPGTLQSKRPYPTVGNIATVRNEPIGNSIYHSLQARAQKRLSAGLSFNLAYTFSKSIDDASDVLAFRQVGVASAQNHYNIRLERAVSTFDRTHVLSSDLQWQLPFGKDRAWMNRGGFWNALLGGWNTGAIFSGYTGLPVTTGVANPNAITNTLGGGLRPNRLGCAALPEDQRSLNRWFNVAAFAAPSPNTFGNASRSESCVRGPALWNVDFLLAKQFNFTERVRLSVRSEFFNAFNHFNPANPNAQIGNQAAGTITGAQGGPRTLQLSLRLGF